VRWALLGLCGLWAGCAPSGLTLEVTTSDPAIVRVELFDADACDEGCPAAVAPPGRAARPTDIYLVADPRPWSAAIDHGIAGFQLRADENTNVSVVVAVGFDALDGGNPRAVAVLRDVPVPASEPAHWQLPLAPAAPIDDAPPTSDRVAVWRQPASPGLACVMIEHAGGDRELVVPKDDTDCDQLAMGECAPWTNLAMNAPSTIAAASCLVKNTSGPSAGVCTLGGPTCSEVAGQTTSCATLDTGYCAPAVLCNCAPWDEACVRDKIAVAATAMPMIECDLPLNSDGTPCDGSSEVRIPIASNGFLSNSSTSCADTLINDVATPLGAFAATVALGGATLGVKRVADPCGTELVYAGKIAMAQTQSLLVDLALDNHNHLVVPLRINFAVGGCTSGGAQCSTTIVTDSMFTCAGATPPVSACAGQGGCGGPLCGGTCCKVGVQCVGDACMCGTGPTCADGFECAAGLISPGCGSVCCGPLGPLCEF
jgi:hypothetical protein